MPRTYEIRKILGVHTVCCIRKRIVRCDAAWVGGRWLDRSPRYRMRRLRRIHPILCRFQRGMRRIRLLTELIEILKRIMRLSVLELVQPGDALRLWVIAIAIMMLMLRRNPRSLG